MSGNNEKSEVFKQELEKLDSLYQEYKRDSIPDLEDIKILKIIFTILKEQNQKDRKTLVEILGKTSLVSERVKNKELPEEELDQEIKSISNRLIRLISTSDNNESR